MLGVGPAPKDGGGAMDLASGANRLIINMMHNEKMEMLKLYHCVIYHLQPYEQ